jgi:GNAT superfamily N-acetyltransferase
VVDDSGYELREVGEDCTDLLAVRRLWFPDAEEDFERRFREWWARECRHRYGVVAYTGSTPVGMANGQVFSRMPAPGRPPAQWLYAANIYVAEEHRRQGLGGRLVRALVEFAQTSGMVRVVLAPSEMSVPLYESLGFRPAHDLMRLDLVP